MTQKKTLNYIDYVFYETNDLKSLIKENNSDFSDFNQLYNFETSQEYENFISEKFKKFKKEFSKYIKWYHKIKKEIDLKKIFDRKTLSVLIDLCYKDNYYYQEIKNLFNNKDLNEEVYEIKIQGSGEGYNDLISEILYDIGIDGWVNNKSKIFIFD